jgi:hypothetical protein
MAVFAVLYSSTLSAGNPEKRKKKKINNVKCPSSFQMVTRRRNSKDKLIQWAKRKGQRINNDKKIKIKIKIHSKLRTIDIG